MILYLLLSVVLMLLPYPPNVRRLLVWTCLVAGLLYALAGARVIGVYRGDGVLLGVMFLLVAAGLFVRALFTRRTPRAA